jgi:putative peptidoglycan lipid II flippase
MIRGILTIGGWTMASRVLGFVRDVLIAASLGAGLVADAFFVALRLPNLFRRLFGEGAFNAAFVPQFASQLAAEGPGPARRFAIEAFSLVAFWLATLTVLGMAGMAWIVAVLAPGFAAIPEKLALAVELSRITFPYLLLICLAAMVSGVLNALDRFGVAAASYVLFNVCMIAALLGLTPFVASGGHALAWGVTVAGVAQLGLLLVASARAGMGLALVRPRLTPPLRRLLRKMAPGVVGAGITQLNLAVDVVIASLLPAGTVSVLYYADRVQQLPLGVIGTAIGTAMLPTLARQVGAGDASVAMSTQNRAIEYALILTLPAAVALMVMSWPIIWTLFGRGAFDADAARLTAQALAVYALGLPAFVLIKVLAPGFFARGDTATPVKIGMVMVAAHLAMNLSFMRPLGHLGPPMATSLAAIMNAAWLWIVLRRRGHLRTDERLRARVTRMIPPALGMGAVLWGMWQVLFHDDMSGGLRLAVLALLTGVGLVVYGLGVQICGAGAVREIMAGLRRR